jgi:hypothetical protein
MQEREESKERDRKIYNKKGKKRREKERKKGKL